MRYIRLRGGCPICEGERKDCRQNPQTKIIYCLAERSAPKGYHHIGLDSQQLFNKYQRDQNASDQQEQIEVRQRRRRKKQQHQATALSIADRDRHFRRIAYHLGLTQKHRQLLSDRGFSDSAIQNLVDQRLVFSWLDGETISGIPDNLPGVHEGKLGDFGSRLAIAVPNESGQIAGIQVHNPYNPDAKYIWISSQNKGGHGPHLANGEMPIAVHGKGSDLWLCDSVGFKPIEAADRHQIKIAGSISGYFANRKEQFAPLVTSSDRIIYAPDAGDAKNKHMLRAIEATNQAITELGKELEIAWWGQIEKSGRDIDEVSTDEIEIISWGQWQEITGNRDSSSPNWMSQITSQDLILTNDLNVAALAQGHCSRAYYRSSFWEFYPKNEQGKRVLEHPILTQLKNKRVVIIAKTQGNPYQNFLCDLGAKQVGTAIEFEGCKVFAENINAQGQMLTPNLSILEDWWKRAQHRSKYQNYQNLTQSPSIDYPLNHQYLPQNLLIDQIQHEDIAIESITGSGKTTLILESQKYIHSQGGIFIHLSFLDSALAETSNAGDLTNINQLEEIDWRAAEYEGLNDICLNFQALYKLTPERIRTIPPKSLVFIDEFSGAMKELAQAATLQGNREIACNNLVQLIQHIKINGGRVIVAQNRIFKVAVDAFSALTGLSLKFLKNEYKGESKTVQFAEGSLKDLAAWIDEKRDRGISIMNPSASQTLTERLCKIEQLKGRSCLRLDKKTRDHHKKFYANPTDYIKAKEPGLFSYTATWGLGGNLKGNDHFDELIAASHALNLESNVQAIARDRSNMDLTIFTLKAQPRDFKPTFAEQILYQSSSNARATLSLHFEPDDVNSLIKPTDTGAILDQLAAQFEAIDNYESQHLKECQVNYYRDRGHQIQFITLPQASDAFTKIWEQAIEQCIDDQTTIGISAPNELIRDADHAAAISASSQATYKMKVAAFNWHLSQQLPGAPMRDRTFYREAFVENDGKFYRTARLVWGAQNTEAIKELERVTIQNSIDTGDCVRRSLKHEYRKCQLIKEIGLLNIGDQEYHNSSLMAQEIYQQCTEYRHEIQQLFNLYISPYESVTRTLNKLIKAITGFIPVQVRTVGPRGHQERVFVLSDPKSTTRDKIQTALSINVSTMVSARLKDLEKDLESHAYGQVQVPEQVNQKINIGDKVSAWWGFAHRWIDGIVQSLTNINDDRNFAATILIENGLSLKIWNKSHIHQTDILL